MRGPGEHTIAIVSAGMSVLDVTAETLAPYDYVLAVNFAVLHEPIWPVIDLWAFQDPLERADRLADHALKAIPALRPEGRPKPWALLPELEALGAGDWPMLDGWKRHRLEIEKSVLELYAEGIPSVWVIKTTPQAVLWAARRDFAKIDVYGADMEGWGSPLTPWNPYRPPEVGSAEDGFPVVQDPRWGEERRIMDEIKRRHPKVRTCMAPLRQDRAAST